MFNMLEMIQWFGFFCNWEAYRGIIICSHCCFLGLTQTDDERVLLTATEIRVTD